jgi:hypothetical protein
MEFANLLLLPVLEQGAGRMVTPMEELEVVPQALHAT